MPKSPFTFKTWDLLTLNPLATLPLTVASFGEEVNSHGGFNAQLDLTDQSVRELNWQDGTIPGRTLIACDFDGALIWGGILWTRNYKKTTGVLSLGASGWGSYMDKRIQVRDYGFQWIRGAPPMQAAKTILEDSQTLPNAVKFTVEVSGELGSTASLSFPLSSPQTIGALIQTLSAFGPYGGFDYTYKVRYAPESEEVPELVMQMRIPYIGRTFGESQLVLRGQDCEDWEWPEDATAEAWSILGVAASGIPEPVVDKHPEEEGVPLLEELVQTPAQNTAKAIQMLAYGELFNKARPVSNPPLTIPLFDADAGGKPGWTQFKDFTLGDELLFLVDPEEGGGRNTDPRFPQGLEAFRRCTTWGAVVNPAGLSTISMVLNATPYHVEFPEYEEPEFGGGGKKEDEKEEEEKEEHEKENTEKETEEKEREPEHEKEAKEKEEAAKKAKEKRKKQRKKERETVKKTEEEGGGGGGLTPEQKECLEDLCAKRSCLDALCKALEECEEEP